MVNVGLMVRLEARPGREEEVERFLRQGLAVVRGELATIVWFAVRLGPSTFGIFDAFADDFGRRAHLVGPVATALIAKAADLFTQPPSIEMVEVVAAKLP
jgi:quinol monooxygenase YgiN